MDGTVNTFAELDSLAVVAATAVTTAGESPYRLNTDLAAQVVDTETGSPPSRLRLDEASHAFFVEMGRMAAACGFTPGEDIVDLTGQAPGLVFALGGLSPGSAWYAGGSPGSDEAAEHNLSLVPDERRRRAWLLASSPGSRFAIEPAPVLRTFGIAFPEDFERCGAGVWPLIPLEIQLWRPGRSAPPADVRLASPSRRVQENPDADRPRCASAKFGLDVAC